MILIFIFSPGVALLHTLCCIDVEGEYICCAWSRYVCFDLYIYGPPGYTCAQLHALSTQIFYIVAVLFLKDVPHLIIKGRLQKFMID